MKKKKTVWIIATLIFIVFIIIIINACKDNTPKVKTNDTIEIFNESAPNVPHTPDDVLKTDKRIARSEDYDLVYTGNSIKVYSLGQVVDEVEIGESTYGGHSRECNHYFLVGNTVKKVKYENDRLEAVDILDGVKRIIDPRSFYSQDEKKALLVEMLNGEFKMYIYAREWVDVQSEK